MRALLAGTAALLAALAASDADAGAIGVAPTRVDLPPHAPAGVVTVRNDADHAMMVQVETYGWEDRPYVDDLTPTRELIAVPPLFDLDPGEERLVRVARRQPLQEGAEASYRLLISEVPQPASDAANGVRFALRLSLPVFTTPAGASPRPAVSGGVQGEGVRLQLVNDGDAHLHVRKLTLHDAAAQPVGTLDTSTYVLAGNTAEWLIETDDRPREPLFLKAETNIGALDLALPLDRP